MTSKVLIVATDAPSRALGQQLHRQYGWMAVLPERPLELLRKVMLHDAGLVVLVLGHETDRAVPLIERLRGHWRRVRVVAVKEQWDAQAETAVRVAGAAMCLQVDELEDAARSLLPQLNAERSRPLERQAVRAHQPQYTMSTNPP